MQILHQLPLQLYVWKAIERTEMQEPFKFRRKQLRDIHSVRRWDYRIKALLWVQDPFLTTSLNSWPLMLRGRQKCQTTTSLKQICSLGNAWEKQHPPFRLPRSHFISSSKPKCTTNVNNTINIHHTEAHSTAHDMRMYVLVFLTKPSLYYKNIL